MTAGGRFGYDEIHARLEEADQNLLAQAVLSEEMQSSREEVIAAVESMRRTDGQQRRSQLKSRVKELERAGNWQEAMRVMEELRAMERK